MKLLAKTNITMPSCSQKSFSVTGCDLLTTLDKIILTADINPGSFLILMDKTISDLYKDKIIKSLAKLGKPLTLSTIEAGEGQKDILKIPNIIKPFFSMAFDRKSCLISIGGGVVTDIGGFLSSILLRGISSIFIPTTLLAQIDAAIGGKNGVDLYIDNGKMLKNMLGTFKQPDLIISDILFLKTLPERELINGLGEMVKYWIGWGMPSLKQLIFIKNNAIKTPERWLKDSSQVEELMKTISICQKIKTDIVEKDPYERLNLRQKLNLGHTIGHAIEGTANGRLSHGEAVTVGLVATAKISVIKGLLKLNKYFIIRNTIQQLGLPVSVKNIDKNKVLESLKFDKKAGSFVLIRDFGDLAVNIVVEQNIINQALDEIIV